MRRRGSGRGGPRGRADGLHSAAPAAGRRLCVSGTAPALIPHWPGDRVKTDRRDVHQSAELLRADPLTRSIRPVATGRPCTIPAGGDRRVRLVFGAGARMLRQGGLATSTDDRRDDARAPRTPSAWFRSFSCQDSSIHRAS